MKNLVEQLLAKEGFSPSECILADFLLKNFRLLAGMSTRQLAKETYTNSAAIVRFSQKLGFGGYTEFKVQFLAEMMERIRNPQVTDFSMTDRDTVQSLMDKVTGLEVEALRSTRGMLDAAQFMRALAMLSKAQHIDFYAMDENLNIAQMAASGFLMANKGTTVHPAMTMQYLSAAGMQKGHVGFFISRTGENRMLIDIAHLLRLRSVPRLLITSAPSSTLSLISTSNGRHSVFHAPSFQSVRPLRAMLVCLPLRLVASAATSLVAASCNTSTPMSVLPFSLLISVMVPLSTSLPL